MIVLEVRSCFFQAISRASIRGRPGYALEPDSMLTGEVRGHGAAPCLQCRRFGASPATCDATMNKRLSWAAWGSVLEVLDKRLNNVSEKVAVLNLKCYRLHPCAPSCARVIAASSQSASIRGSGSDSGDTRKENRM